MTLQADIATAMRSVITQLGQAWTYRTLTSAYDAETRTYSTATACTVHFVSEQNGEEFDEKRHIYARRRHAMVKVTDAVALNAGDQLIDTLGKYWHVDGAADATNMDGIVRYLIARDIPLLGSSDRGGGV